MPISPAVYVQLLRSAFMPIGPKYSKKIYAFGTYVRKSFALNINEIERALWNFTNQKDANP